MADTQMLSQINLLKGIPEESLKDIAGISEEVTYKKGSSVFTEGSGAESIYFLLEGEVDIQVDLASKHGDVSVAAINMPYQSFGWSGVIPPYHFTASALCMADCRILKINGSKLIQILQREPESGFVVMQRISELIARRLRNSRMALLKTI
jgi:toluene monooxygenase system ferredoxin subunit